MSRPLYRYRVDVGHEVLGSFQREIRAETAQQAAALVLARMGDPGPFGGGAINLDPWLHSTALIVTVECLEIDKLKAALTIPPPAEFTLHTIPKRPT